MSAFRIVLRLYLFSLPMATSLQALAESESQDLATVRTGLTKSETEALARATEISRRVVGRLASALSMSTGHHLHANSSLLGNGSSATKPKKQAAVKKVKTINPDDLPDIEQRHLPKTDEVVEGKGSPFMLGFVSIGDHNGAWSPSKLDKGMQEVMELNRAQAKKFNYRMVVRKAPTLADHGLTPQQVEGCRGLNITDRDACRRKYERMSFNWEKEAMLVDYLSQRDVKYAMALDCDAAMVHKRDDTMKKMAAELERTGRDILIADEDWWLNGKGMLNGGMVFAKNTPFTRKFFNSIVQAHIWGHNYTGPGSKCFDNEQLCLSASVTAYPGLKDKLLVASGGRWNRHPCAFSPKGCKAGKIDRVPSFDPQLQVVHFMGGAKSAAHRTLFNLGIVSNKP